MTIETILTMCGSVIMTIISTIITVWVKISLEKRFKEQKELDDLRAEQERQERKEDVLASMREELSPLTLKLDSVNDIVSKNKEGTVTLLRESMKLSRDTYISRGYVSASELANWHQLNNTYKDLGGNHFKEYVDEWQQDVESLPRQVTVAGTNINIDQDN